MIRPIKSHSSAACADRLSEHGLPLAAYSQFPSCAQDLGSSLRRLAAIFYCDHADAADAVLETAWRSSCK